MITNEVVLKAISFASRKHDGQLRKDGKTPYVSHAFRVLMILRHVFGVTNERILVAAVLHDVIEDTTTDFDDVEKEFGRDIASWVALLTKDKRKQNDDREKEYYRTLGAAPDEVKIIKLADLADNTIDSSNAGSNENTKRTLGKIKKYLSYFEPSMNKNTAEAFQVVKNLINKKIESGI